MNAGQRIDAQRLQNALRNLQRRIEAGEEFPDACWAVSSRENVPYEALQTAYDEAQDGEAKAALLAGLLAHRVAQDEADALTRKHSAFNSFQELVDAQGNYSPSIHCGPRNTDAQERAELLRLADIYDAHQLNRGDYRRAYRF